MIFNTASVCLLEFVMTSVFTVYLIQLAAFCQKFIKEMCYVMLRYVMSSYFISRAFSNAKFSQLYLSR